MNREAYQNLVSTELTEQDVRLINDHGHDQDKISMLAVEHAERTRALLNTVDDTMAANILVMLSSRFLRFSEKISG